MLTWPSPASTTLPWWRTARMVVARTFISSRSRVRTVVGPHQVVEVHVSVPLGGRQARMAEQLLDGAQVRSLIQEMGGEAVAERVRARGNRRAGECDIALDEASDAS